MLIIISLAALLLRFSDQISQTFLGIKPTSGISVLSQPTEAKVYLDSQEVGQTPFEDKNLKVGDYIVKVEKDGAYWQGKVSLLAGTITVINRDLAQDQASSSGEILTLEKGAGLTVISNPAGADIEIDGKTYGKTPSTVNINTGDHTILLSYQNYLSRSIRVNLPESFNLTVSADLALTEADLTTITTPVINQTPQVTVLQTPTGFLRVRDKPSLNGKETAQVTPGDVLVLLEELDGWDRVRLDDKTEGFVSSAYVEKKNP